jgi:hypothetical protein
VTSNDACVDDTRSFYLTIDGGGFDSLFWFRQFPCQQSSEPARPTCNEVQNGCWSDFAETHFRHRPQSDIIRADSVSTATEWRPTTVYAAFENRMQRQGVLRMNFSFASAGLSRALVIGAMSASFFIGTEAAQAADCDPHVIDAMSRNVPLSVKAHHNVKSQWMPLLKIGISFAEVEDDDILLIQHFKGHGKKAKKWGKVQKCREPRADDRLKRNFGENIVFFNCDTDKSLLNKKGGKYSAKITYRQTGAGIDHNDIRTLEYTVDSFGVDASGSSKQMGFEVNHDSRLGEGWLALVGDGTKKGQKVRLSTWLKWDTQGEPRNVKMRCYHGKKKIGEFISHNRYDVKIVDYKKKCSTCPKTMVTTAARRHSTVI